MSIDMSQFHEAFFEESFEGLEIMESELLTLDVGEGDVEIINTIFRAAHSIKGGAGTFGFMNVSEFTHVMETLLDEMRDGSREVTQFAVDSLLESVDVLRSMLEAARDKTEVDEDMVAARYAVLNNILKENGGASSATDDAPAEATPAPLANEQTAEALWTVDFIPHADLLMAGNDPVRMFRALSELGELQVNVDLEKLPPFDELAPEDLCLSWQLTLSGDVARSAIEEVFEWVEDDCDLIITSTGGNALADSPPIVEPAAHVEAVPEAAPAPATAAPSVNTAASDSPAAKKSAAKPKKATESASIRVGIDKIDEIINLVGELVITQSMLDQAGDDLEANADTVGNDSESQKTNADILLRLSKGLAQLERNTRELQDGVMRIRMLPISFVFSRMPRLVHDLTGKLNKKVELVLSGEETELDKTVMENIGDPLVHLVRNALDHGVETPDIRRAAGKDETGVLSLNAYHQGGNIIIEIKDDGAGINKKKVRDKAIEKGIISATDNLSDEEVNNLIFAPGFSTAEVVSDVSGRGVGMDVVKTSINKLGGRVVVQSEEGKGSVFTIRLPLTLAILDGQLVTVGGESYVIPLIAIIESLQVDRAQINAVAGKAEVYKLRDQYIPIMRARAVFGLDDSTDDLHDSLMVVVEVDGSPIGIIVDELQGQQQVVIKSLETNYRKVETMSGATILGDGTVALIWDVNGMVRVHNKKLNKGLIKA
ncbi:chemotaxis protein CheA [Cycloclasticus sp. 46_120_T64]|nr:chemotaxis protein CheA [Cycloclasticus sp. 46_120_T64]